MHIVHSGAQIGASQGDPAQQRVSIASLVASVQPAASAADLLFGLEGLSLLVKGSACALAQKYGRQDNDIDRKAFSLELPHSAQPFFRASCQGQGQ